MIKRLLLLGFFLCLVSGNSQARDELERLFSSRTILYWCFEQELPKKLSDMKSVFEFDKFKELDEVKYQNWKRATQFTIEGDILKVIRKTRVLNSDGGERLSIMTSTSNCDSIKFED